MTSSDLPVNPCPARALRKRKLETPTEKDEDSENERLIPPAKIKDDLERNAYGTEADSDNKRSSPSELNLSLKNPKNDC